MEKQSKYSRIVAGTMTWGDWGKQLSQKQMQSLLHHCIELGMSTFDHADIYGGYTNEAYFGKAFSKSGIKREDIQLVSKCGIQYRCEKRPHAVGHYQYDAPYIVESVEQSLVNLRTDYLDLLLLHRPSPLMDPQEILEAISQLRDAGKVRDFGVSNFTPSQLAMVNTNLPVQANQIELSLTHTQALYDGSLDDCMQHQRMAMAWSPLGHYFKKKGKKHKRLKKVLKPLQEKYNASSSQLLLAWILKHPAKIHPVIGTTQKDRLEAAAKALDISLELEDWFILLEAAHGHAVP